MRGVDLEVDRLTIDALVVTSDPGRLILDFTLDIGKVCESPARYVYELSPLRSASSCGRFVGITLGVGRILVLGHVDQLQDQRSTGADATAPR